MTKFFALIAMLILTACGPNMTHEQVKAVTEVCHAQGLQYKVRGDEIICRTKTDK